MRTRTAAFLILLFAATTPKTLAQAEYFTNAELTAGGELSLVNSDAQSGWGAGVEVLLTPSVGVTMSFARSTVDLSSGRFDNDTVESSAFSAGVQLYPSRQREGQPVSVGMGLQLGRTEGASTFGATALIARSFVATGEGPGFQFIPKVEAAYTLALLNETVVSAQTLAAGLGIGIEVSQGVVWFVEPTAAVTLAENETQTFVGATIGFGASRIK